ncbi:extracellular lipase [Ceratobasidium theobromae]|uniref:Carboxylic ester hydrolase n=1 Tax=Ceratobasidium theobromae TaxID=1582974 RepID=A0A5N5QA28_9AGAM|nr:extracellular lipase [Ceratobasidium theobromae]
MPSTLWSSVTLALAAVSSARATSPIVKGSNVSWLGVRNSTANYDYFFNVPFGQAPVGSLRFKPPVEWSPDTPGVTVNATAYGNSCEEGIDRGLSQISEDCLNLNIWRPSGITEKVPVLVWIYGGGFYFGAAVGYPGDQIVVSSMRLGKPVIYVAFNYRTGLFGFPPGQDAAAAGALNLGLKDQRLALEWIQKNIGYFGGDPTKVTLFGESAGAISTGYQSLYNGGDIGGVFHGMILESGSPSSVNVAPANDPVLESAYAFVVNATGCSNSTQKFECVRNAPANVLRQANRDVILPPAEWMGVDQGPVVLGPVLAPGDVFLPELPSQSLRAGRFAKVPFINGDELDEGTVFTNETTPETDELVIEWLTKQIPGLYFGINNVTAVKELLKFYPADPAAGSPYNTGNDTFGLAAQFKRLNSIVGDLIFHAARRDHLRIATQFGVDAWSYHHTEAVPGADAKYGVYHGAELVFVFQVVDPSVPQGLLDLGEAVIDYWLTFAYTLNPNPTSGTARPYWPKYGTNQTSLGLASNITIESDTFRSEGIDFIINSPSLYN